MIVQSTGGEPPSKAGGAIVARIFVFLSVLVFAVDSFGAPPAQIWRTSLCHDSPECVETFLRINDEYPVVGAFHNEMTQLTNSKPSSTAIRWVRRGGRLVRENRNVVIFRTERFEFPTPVDRTDPLPGLRRLIFFHDFSLPALQGEANRSDSVGFALHWTKDQNSAGGQFHWMAACRNREACNRLNIPTIPPPSPFPAPAPNGNNLNFGNWLRDTSAVRCNQVDGFMTRVVLPLFGQSQALKVIYQDYEDSEKIYPNHQCRFTEPKTPVKAGLPVPQAFWAQAWNPTMGDILGFRAEYLLEDKGLASEHRTLVALFACGSRKGCQEIGLPSPFRQKR
jgi:hypothetical protein